MIDGHECNAFCHDGEHCELLYTEDGPEDRVRLAVAQMYAWGYGARLVRLERAQEAAPLAALPTEMRRLEVGRTSVDEARWLAWFTTDEDDNDG